MGGRARRVSEASPGPLRARRTRLSARGSRLRGRRSGARRGKLHCDRSCHCTRGRPQPHKRTGCSCRGRRPSTDEGERWWEGGQEARCTGHGVADQVARREGCFGGGWARRRRGRRGRGRRSGWQCWWRRRAGRRTGGWWWRWDSADRVAVEGVPFDAADALELAGARVPTLACNVQLVRAGLVRAPVRGPVGADMNND